jgi:predicted phosphodiesterase
MIIKASKEYKGILTIGDPHIEGRVPGFRKDDYPAVILEKMRWALNYAAKNELLPVLLGDLFHMPRNNPNWLLVKVMQLFDMEIFGIYGNHDVHENKITEDDSISVIAEAGKLMLLDNNKMVMVKINNKNIILGGTPWGKNIPDNINFDIKADLVIWITHHDIKVPGYEEKGHIHPRELSDIDIVINGHIHRYLEDVKKGKTLWLTPGNISRRTRGDASKTRKPSALHIDINEKGYSYKQIEAPHKPFEEIFYEAVMDADYDQGSSAFVTGLTELQVRKTETGEGLKSFLEKNLDKFDYDVSKEIMRLTEEVMKK